MSLKWEKQHDYTDIIYEYAEGIGKITINRPEVRNAFRPETLFELEARTERELEAVAGAVRPVPR